MDPLTPPAAVRHTEHTKALVAAKFHQFEEAGRQRLAAAHKLGEVLAEEKKNHPGTWIAWVEANCPFSRDRAADFIRVHTRRAECRDAATFEEALRTLREADAAAAGPAEDGGPKPVVVAHGVAGYWHEETEQVVCEKCNRDGRPADGCRACLGVRASYREQKKREKNEARNQKKKDEKAQGLIEFDPDVRMRKALAAARETARLFRDDMKALLEFPAATEALKALAAEWKVPLQPSIDSTKAGSPGCLIWPAAEYPAPILAELAKKVGAADA